MSPDSSAGRIDRIGQVRRYVDGVLMQIDGLERETGCSHLHGVAQLCALLAMKRGGNAELAVIAGLLHDIAAYQTLDPIDHARRSASLASGILRSMGLFSEEEIRQIEQAIRCHSEKSRQGAPLDELLKDADVLQHFLSDPLSPTPERERARLRSLQEELELL